MRGIVFFLFVLIFLTSCSSNQDIVKFEEDYNQLKEFDDVIFLRKGNSMLAVAGSWQGRVLTSSTNGMAGNSCGWYNRELLKNGNPVGKLARLGGEGRFWFGPEIGKYSIFFDPGAEQVAENIQISQALDSVRFRVTTKTDHELQCEGEMKIRNANGYIFNVEISRRIKLKCKDKIELELGINYDKNISAAAFSAETTMKNIGEEAWTKENGLLSIWEISCIPPSENAVVVIPIWQNTDSITVYFTPVDSTRLKIADKVVYYKGDAAYMNKIGLQPELCVGMFGSYSPERHLLTIVKYNFDNAPMYANCLWGHKDPYKGDVINVFNGEVNDSLGRNWPFYEMESLSEVKELGVGEEIHHQHSVYHFEGDELGLDKIARKLLGVSLNDIATAFAD